MEAFLVSFSPVSAINIFTAFYKWVESGEWTGDCDKERENFIKTLNHSLNIIDVNDNERLERLHWFGTGDELNQHYRTWAVTTYVHKNTICGFY
ncbi:20282_t:CDS:2 [Entrophospora sp. SA101]|nr:20282_t:CDS:2 [Entrophospora sp. SA101]